MRSPTHCGSPGTHGPFFFRMGGAITDPMRWERGASRGGEWVDRGRWERRVGGWEPVGPVGSGGAGEWMGGWGG